ncbi:hypothetical protein BHM03_00008825 [Ensete ventricosum]|nr:hypothetical protein BHM03_00008825 [Ensete ventricosum]
MQGLVHGRRSVRGHPKVQSELGIVEHQNFLFDMEKIRPGGVVCASKLALDESLSHQHMRVVYHRGRSPSASTSESHGEGRDPGAVGSSTSVNNITARRAVDSRGECHGTAENIISASPATIWQRPYMRVAVCLSIDQGGLLGGHSGVEAGGQKGQGSDESSGAQLPKSKASVRKDVDSEEHHSVIEADLPIAKEGIQMQGNG